MQLADAIPATLRRLSRRYDLGMIIACDFFNREIYWAWCEIFSKQTGNFSEQTGNFNRG
jgi:hypothetical protein